MERGNLVDEYGIRKAYPHQRKRTAQDLFVDPDSPRV
jgi:hypothetical protein